jgi:hypothetical protein
VRIFYAGVLSMLVIVVALGCGSGGSTETALTKAQLLKRGDAACHDGLAKKIKAVAAWSKEEEAKGKSFGDWSKKQLGRIYLTVVLPPIKETSAELAELANSSQDPKAEKVATALSSAVKSIEGDPIQVIKELPYAGADKLAKSYGFKVCGLF